MGLQPSEFLTGYRLHPNPPTYVQMCVLVEGAGRDIPGPPREGLSRQDTTQFHYMLTQYCIDNTPLGKVAALSTGKFRINPGKFTTTILKSAPQMSLLIGG